MKKVILKKGKEKAIKNRHHWIFSGAVQQMDGEGRGEILPVYSSDQEFLGQAYFNRKSNIIGRMIAFEEGNPLEKIEQLLTRAVRLRNRSFDPSLTNAYRLVNSEGDGLPGLVVDVYDDQWVVQVSTLGMEKLKPFVLKVLKNLSKPRSIFEKSTSSSRREEGLQPFEGVLDGDFNDAITIVENGIKFSVSILKGQKTGFFLDHREMRKKIEEFSCHKNVLNCFSYSGGFSLYAARGGALSVTSVDVSEPALEMAKQSVLLNQMDPAKFVFAARDVFEFLRTEDLLYDLVILDPPAFAKKQKDVMNACRGYKEINRLAFKKMPMNSILLTSSCSHFIDEKLFQQVVFQAAAEAGRAVQIIGKHQLAIDHPINLYHPETEYLKSLILNIA